MLVTYTGNCPKNVNKDAKYAVRSQHGSYVVGIVYRTNHGEEWRPFTDDHKMLVDMVNEVKVLATGNKGGSFYINEYKQVIVPASDGQPGYYFAGEYEKALEFEFENQIISGNAMNLQGGRLNQGDLWTGPHAGIPYVLSAGKPDIYYEMEVRPYVIRKVSLSQCIGHDQAVVVARSLLRHKPNGGRIYVNEYCQVFAPVDGAQQMEYIYLGDVNLDRWFPKPSGL